MTNTGGRESLGPPEGGIIFAQPVKRNLAQIIKKINANDANFIGWRIEASLPGFDGSGGIEMYKKISCGKLKLFMLIEGGGNHNNHLNAA